MYYLRHVKSMNSVKINVLLDATLKIFGYIINGERERERERGGGEGERRMFLIEPYLCFDYFARVNCNR